MVSRFLENLFIFQVQYTVPSLLTSSQSYGFSCGHVWMWELDCKESWALKNWCFWTVVLEKTLKVPWTARRFNQSILNDNSPEYSLKGLMLKMKLQYLMWCEELTHLKRPWCWERLKVGEEDNRGWDGWMVSPIQWTWVWVNSGSWWWTEKPGVLQSMELERVGHNWATELNLYCTVNYHKSLEKSVIIQNSFANLNTGKRQVVKKQ